MYFRLFFMFYSINNEEDLLSSRFNFFSLSLPQVSHLTDSSSPGQEDRNISYGSYGVNDSQDNQDGHRQSYTQQEMYKLTGDFRLIL